MGIQTKFVFSNTMVLNVVVGLTSLRSMGHEAKLNQENNWKFSKYFSAHTVESGLQKERGKLKT